MLFLCDHNKKDPDGQQKNCQTQENIWERERNGPFSSNHTTLLSAIKDNR